MMAAELGPAVRRRTRQRPPRDAAAVSADHGAGCPTCPAPERERLLRTRTALLTLLEGLARAHRAHGDLAWSADDLAATVRRWIEAQTFAPRTGAAGVHMVDATAARFGVYDDVHLVGLVDGEWPRRARRNLFYSPVLLQPLGWPSECRAGRGCARRVPRPAAARPAAHDGFGVPARRRLAHGTVSPAGRSGDVEPAATHACRRPDAHLRDRGLAGTADRRRACCPQRRATGFGCASLERMPPTPRSMEPRCRTPRERTASAPSSCTRSVPSSTSRATCCGSRRRRTRRRA